jgi:hypothetical protein
MAENTAKHTAAGCHKEALPITIPISKTGADSTLIPKQSRCSIFIILVEYGGQVFYCVWRACHNGHYFIFFAQSIHHARHGGLC